MQKKEKKFIRQRIEKNKRLYSTEEFTKVKDMLNTNEILFTTYALGCVDALYNK